MAGGKEARISDYGVWIDLEAMFPPEDSIERAYLTQVLEMTWRLAAFDVDQISARFGETFPDPVDAYSGLQACRDRRLIDLTASGYGDIAHFLCRLATAGDESLVLDDVGT